MATEKTDTTSWDDLQQVASKLLVPGVTEDVVTDMYNVWAKNGYDKVLQDAADKQEYGAISVLKAAMEELFPVDTRRQAVVLDVGAGTGISGKTLRELGFDNVDGLEPAADMLQIAQDKKIYRHVFNSYLTADPLDISADTYDAIVLVGVIGHGCVPCAAFTEMARLIKPGGYIVNCMRRAYLHEVPDFKENWEPMVSKLEEEEKWKLIKMEPYKNHFMGKEGLLVVLKVC